MEIDIGKGRWARRSYGFEEISIVPGDITVDPELVDVSLNIGELGFDIPILGAAMDGIVDPYFAGIMGKLGGLAVLNLQGIQTRYDNPKEVLERIISAPQEKATEVMQVIYREPIKEELVYKRIKEIKEKGVIAACSSIPQEAERMAKIAVEAGVDIFVVQSTVITERHRAKSYTPLSLEKFTKSISIPVIVGNVVSYNVAMELFATGIAGILVGVGPGGACTTRQVLGIGVPQVTAIADVAYARDVFYHKTGRYVAVIADGGMNTGGDIAKAIACGADGVMLGQALARAEEAFGKGYHWGMAMSHSALPRGTRVYTGTTGTLKEILLGPAKRDDGTQNLVGALKNSLGVCGAINIKEMHQVELVVAPSIKT
ncbi:MAG: GuaB3 family IMP dehydrogenase-related protein, partial [bacterium]